MISTFLVEHPWLTTVALLAMVVLGPLAGLWSAARPRLAGALAAASLAPVAALTLSPTTRELQVGCVTEWSVPTLGAVEPMANVVLFVPPALLLGVALARPLTALVVASTGSALIELVQALATTLGRSCSTNDWLANSLGAALGALLALVALRLRRHLSRDVTPAARPTQPAGRP